MAHSTVESMAALPPVAGPTMPDPYTVILQPSSTRAGSDPQMAAGNQHSSSSDTRSPELEEKAEIKYNEDVDKNGNNDPEDIGAPPETFPNIPLPRTLGIGAVMIATSMTSAMASQVAMLGITKISDSLNISTSEQQWLTTSFSIAFGCFLLVAGRIADIFGRKVTYICGTISFAIWLLISGFMRDKVGMFVARAICGLSSSLAVPSAIGIVAQCFPPGRKRSIIFAVFGSGFPVGTAVGFVLCGLLVETNWRLVFWVLSGLTLLPAIGAWFFFPSIASDSHKGNRLRQIDFVGAALVTSGMLLLLFSLSDGLTASKGFATPYIITCLILSILLIVLFVLWELYVERNLDRPCLMKLSLFTRANGKLAAVYGSATFTLMAFSSFGFLSTIFYQEYQGLSPRQTTVRLIPMAVSGALCNVLVALLATRVKGQILFALGCMGTTIAFLLFAVQSVGASYWRYQFWAMCLIVFGADFTQSAASIFVSKLVDADEQSVAGGLFQTFTQIGGAVGTTLVTVIYTEIAAEESTSATNTMSLETAQSPSFLAGLRGGYYFGCALAGFSFIIVIISMRGMGYIEERKPKHCDLEEAEQSVK